MSTYSHHCASESVRDVINSPPAVSTHLIKPKAAAAIVKYALMVCFLLMTGTVVATSLPCLPLESRVSTTAVVSAPSLDTFSEEEDMAAEERKHQ